MSTAFVLFEEAGKFQAGRLMSESDSTMQVEMESGKRVKVKAANVMLRFSSPPPAELLAKAGPLSAEIDLDLIWETAPDDDFGFEALAADYFGAKPASQDQAAMLWRLHEAPHYFHRRGKGKFRKAPADVLKAALAGIEKKKLVAAQIDAWAKELLDGQCPAPVREQLYKILFKPDKNAAEYKAVVEASRQSQKAPLALLTHAGAIDSPYQFHWRRFLFDAFPKGTKFEAAAAPAITDELPLATVQAFSIDDSSTTEIDDALSVQGLGSGTVVFGVHIAAPGLAILPGSSLDQVARSRYSTVYMPGHKITMLPDEVVASYTLAEGRACPAVSLYVTFDETSLAVTHSATRLEQVPIAANLRHDRLEASVTEASLSGETAADYAFAPELAFAHRLAKHLKAAREVVRGKPEIFNRPDYSYRLDGVPEGGEPSGQETVHITERRRGSPLDLIVAEAMILANSHWGAWLNDHGVPGIYRSQASLSPGIKVRMGTKALPHAGMGVAQYVWATSPLRRYTDLVNQWQIIACAKQGRTAALVAPFKPKDAELFSVISGFEAAYSSYQQFQNGMERYWTLRHVQQSGVDTLIALGMKDGWVRGESLPLVVRAVGAESLPRGSRVRIRVASIDLLTLEAHASVIERLDLETQVEGADDDDASDDEAPNQGLSLAIDVNESSGASDSTSAVVAP